MLRTDTALFAASGGRLALTVPLSPSVALAGHGEILLPIWRPSAAIDVAEVWRMPPVAAGAGLGAWVRFP